MGMFAPNLLPTNWQQQTHRSGNQYSGDQKYGARVTTVRLDMFTLGHVYFVTSPLCDAHYVYNASRLGKWLRFRF
jgi:hypothetical protein